MYELLIFKAGWTLGILAYMLLMMIFYAILYAIEIYRMRKFLVENNMYNKYWKWLKKW